MDPEELKAMFDEARQAVGRISDEKLNSMIAAETNGEATDLFTLSNLVRQSRTDITDEQRRASNESVAVTSDEDPSCIPAPLRGVAAGLQTFGQGVTLGGGDELSGLASRFIEGLRPGSTAESRRAAGRAGTEDARAGLDEFREAHPVLAPALQVAGGVATGAAIPGVGGFLRGASSVPGAIARGAALGAGEGGVAGALSGEGVGERLKGGAIGVGLGGALGGAAGGAAGFVTRFANSLQGVGTPTKRKAVNLVRNMVDRVAESKRTNTADLPGITRTARAMFKDDFTLASLDVFSDIADDISVSVAQRGRLAPSLLRETGVETAGELAGTAAMATVQPQLAIARAGGGIFKKLFNKVKARQAEDLVDELNRILQSTDPGVQDRFLKSLLRSRPAGEISLTAGSALTGGVAVEPDAVINPLLDR